MRAKIGAIGIKVVLFLLIMTTVFAQQAVAKPQYLVALRFVYGDGSCTTCHKDQNGGNLTDYGSRFSDQHIHVKDSVIALRSIGDPAKIVLATPVIVTMTPVSTYVSPTETTIPVANTSVVTTVVPTIRSNWYLGFGFGVIFTIGIILVLFMLRKLIMRR